VYEINPGLSRTFPWGHATSNSFEKYHVINMTVRYQPTTRTDRTARIVIVPEYDPSDPSPPDEATALNTAGATSGAVWQEMSIPLISSKIHSANRWLLTRSEPPTTSIQNYDGVKVFFSAYSDSNVIPSAGFLFLDYEIELKTPQVPRSLPLFPAGASLLCRLDTQQLPDSIGLTDFKLTFPDVSFDTLGIKDSNGDWILPKGTYRVKTRFCMDTDAAEKYNVNVNPPGPQGSNNVEFGVPSQESGENPTGAPVYNSWENAWDGYWNSDGDTPFVQWIKYNGFQLALTWAQVYLSRVAVATNLADTVLFKQKVSRMLLDEKKESKSDESLLTADDCDSSLVAEPTARTNTRRELAKRLGLKRETQLKEPHLRN
jgi:hypothetical protein